MEIFQDSGAELPLGAQELWIPSLILLWNLADLLVFTACLAIALLLGYFAYKRRESPYRPFNALIGLFILVCGATFLMDTVRFYQPLQQLSGAAKVVAAAVGWGTFLVLFRVVPRLLQSHIPTDLEREIEQGRDAEVALKNTSQHVEASIGLPTFELERADAERRTDEERFRLLTEAMPQIVWTARPDGFLDYYNQQWVDYTGMSVEQSQGLGWQPVLHPDDLPRCLEMWNHSMESGEIYQCEHRFKRARDGAYRWHLGRALPLRDKDGKIIQWFGTCTDIDDQKSAQEELRRSHAELEKRVQERTAELERANDVQQHLVVELERSNSELEQFAYVASHDLQEPLRAMSGTVQVLQRRYQGKLDARADDLIVHAVAAVVRMQTLVSDLLAFSRLSRQGNTFAPTDCEAVLGDVLKDLRIAIEQSDATITHDSLPQVTGDASQLRQLFQNLLSNAIKFKDERPLEIHVGAQREEKAWRFSIRDNGQGIEPQYFERIFIIFQRLHTRDEYPGTGIGLAVCKKIVERHGGRIWLDSEVGVGTTFSFTIANTPINEDLTPLL